MLSYPEITGMDVIIVLQVQLLRNNEQPRQ